MCLDSLTKVQLLEIAKNTNIHAAASKSKGELVEAMSIELASHDRLENVVKGFDEKDFQVIKMFLVQKKLRYEGMSQGEFARFLQLKMHQANSYASCISKLSNLGLIFTSVRVKDDPKVIFPSEYLRFFDERFKTKTSS
ncbi:MAG TPA: hypothetical protein VKM55_25725 [Candidatus Lokiarchaeia archaeon]|nr:hypothetical protein [Candidatus Lokiarchaeia archaeon]